MNFLKLIKNFLEHLTEKPSASIVDEPTSAKIIMKDNTEQVVEHIHDWVVSLIEDYDKNGTADQIYDKLAIIDEWYEFLNPDNEHEVLIVDKISEEEYSDFVDYMNNDLERG